MNDPVQNQNYFSIGKVAKLLGLSIETLRRWDRAGKIRAGRTPGGKRVFTQEDINSIKVLLQLSSSQPQNTQSKQPKQTYAKEKTLVKPTQIPTSGSSANVSNPDRIVLLSIPKINFSKLNINFTKASIALVILILVGSNIFFLSQTPLPGKAVLGVETFIAPALEEGGVVESFLSPLLSSGQAIESAFQRFGSFVGTRASLFALGIINNNQTSNTPTDLSISGKGTFAKDIEGQGNLRIKGTAIVGKLITGIIDPYLIENDGSYQSTLEIRSVGDISLEPGGNVTIGGLVINNSSLSFVNNITTTGNITTNNITTTSNTTIGGNITLSGVINGNTLSSTSLIFSGSSPSIYPSTTNSQISLNANGTGAINIGNSSTGDIYLGGGSTSGTYCLITNSNGSLNCAGDITSQGNLYANGGSLKTTATTAYLFNDTATTLNLGKAATALSIGAASGTTTINNNETLTGNFTQGGTSTFGTGTGAVSLNGAVTASLTLGVTGTTSLNGAVNIGDGTSDDIAVNGRITTSILPKTTGSVDLGSSSLKFNNLYSNTINTAAINTSGQGVFNLNPASTAITDASLLVNPTSVTNAGSALLGIAVAGVEKARIDETGKLTLQGGLSVPSGGITFSNLSTAGVVTNTSAGVLGTLAGTTTTVLHGNAAGAPTFAAITGSDLDPAITISTTGNLTTTGSGTITSAGTLTASNGFTQTTGALSLTGTSGSIGLTGFGTTSITSTTTSGDVIAATDTSLNTASANLSNFTFKNNNTAAAGLAVNGVTITEQSAAAPLSGTNTSNLLNLAASANGTVNGINISSATGFTNFIKTPTFNLDSSGNVTGVAGLTATNLTGAIQTASQTNITAVGTLGSLAVTGNINSASGALQTNGVTRIDNSGNFTAVTGSFGGNINPSLDDTYDLGTSSLRWKNAFFSGDVNVGDTVFKNKFRLTEHGDTGIDMLNPKGEVIASWDKDGNFWVKGEIKHAGGN